LEAEVKMSFEQKPKNCADFGLTPLEEIIPETKIVVFAPHFDDFLLTIGGYVLELQKADLLHKKEFHIIILFSKSNYLARDEKGNLDISLDRIKLATGKRLLEDLNCIDEVLGEFNYEYQLINEKECIVREKSFADSEMEFPHGVFEDFDALDWQIFERMKKRIQKYAMEKDTAIILPLAIKEHIDHFITREAGVAVSRELGPSAGARFYFQEDKPYSGIASEEELKRIELFESMNNLESRYYKVDAERMIELTFKHYISQVEEIYKTGIRERTNYFKKLISADHPCDRVLTFKSYNNNL
jgi:hypothetical protein